MTVRGRLVAFGAALPTLALVIAVAIAGWIFRTEQLADIDQRLLAQAAVESVGLFDGPDGTPHVHVPESPLAREVAELATEAAVYDARGALVARVPDRSVVPTAVPLAGAVGEVRLSTAAVAGIARRVLAVVVRAPDGKPYTLWLGASFAPVDATMRARRVVPSARIAGPPVLAHPEVTSAIGPVATRLARCSSKAASARRACPPARCAGHRTPVTVRRTSGEAPRTAGSANRGGP